MRFARFATAAAIEPEAVTSDTLEEFVDYLTRRTNTSRPKKVAGYARAAFNSLRPPGEKLKAAGDARLFILPLSAFPQDFADDLSRFEERMAGGRNRISSVLDADRPILISLSGCRPAPGAGARPGLGEEAVRGDDLVDLAEAQAWVCIGVE